MRESEPSALEISDVEWFAYFRRIIFVLIAKLNPHRANTCVFLFKPISHTRVIGGAKVYNDSIMLTDLYQMYTLFCTVCSLKLLAIYYEYKLVCYRSALLQRSLETPQCSGGDKSWFIIDG